VGCAVEVGPCGLRGSGARRGRRAGRDPSSCAAGIAARSASGNAEPIFARAAPAPAPEPKKEAPREPIDIATAYLQHILDGKPEQALKLADPKAVTEQHTKEIRASELKRVKFVMVLANNARVQVVTERAS